MRFCTICHLITDAGCQDENSPVCQLRFQPTFQAKQDMPFFAPVVSQITWTVCDHANANLAKMLCAPEGSAARSLMLGNWNRVPVGGSKRDIFHLHRVFLCILS